MRLRYTLTSTSERARALGYLTHLETSTFVIPLNSSRAHGLAVVVASESGTARRRPSRLKRRGCTGLAVFACRGKRNTDKFDWDVWENRLAELGKMLEQVGGGRL